MMPIEGQMTEVKRIRRELLDDVRNRRHWELKEEAEDRINILSIEHTEEIQVVFHISMDLIINSIINNNNNNNNNNNINT